MDTSESFRPFQFPFILCGTVDCTKTVQVPVSNCAETVHFSYSFVHFLYSRRRPHRQFHRLGISLCNYSNLWLLSAKGSLRLALGSPLPPHLIFCQKSNKRLIRYWNIRSQVILCFVSWCPLHSTQCAAKI